MRWQDELKRQPELPPVVERRLQETYAQVRARASEKQEEPMNVTSIARKTVVGALIAAALATTAMAGYASGSNAVFADFFRAVFGGQQEQQTVEPAGKGGEDAATPQKLECKGFTFTIGRNCYDPVIRMGVLEVTVDNPENGKGLHAEGSGGRHLWSGKRPDWEDAGMTLQLLRSDGNYFDTYRVYYDTERSTMERAYLYVVYDNTGGGDKPSDITGLKICIHDFTEPSAEVQKELDAARQNGVGVYNETLDRLQREGKYHAALTETIEVPLGSAPKSWQATNENGEWEISVSEIGLRYNYPLLSQARDKIVLHFADGTDYTVLVMDTEMDEDGHLIRAHLDQTYVTLIDPVLCSMTFDHMIDMDQLVSVSIDDRTWTVAEK